LKKIHHAIQLRQLAQYYQMNIFQNTANDKEAFEMSSSIHSPFGQKLIEKVVNLTSTHIFNIIFYNPFNLILIHLEKIFLI